MTELDVLLVGAEELENLSTRYLAAVLRQHGYSVELAPFSTAQEMDAVVRHKSAFAPAGRAVDHLPIPRAGVPRARSQAHRGLAWRAHHDRRPLSQLRRGRALRDHPRAPSVVRGEGELTLLELVQQLDAPRLVGRDPRPVVSPGRPGRQQPRPGR